MLGVASGDFRWLMLNSPSISMEKFEAWIQVRGWKSLMTKAVALKASWTEYRDFFSTALEPVPLDIYNLRYEPLLSGIGTTLMGSKIDGDTLVTKAPFMLWVTFRMLEEEVRILKIK